MALVDKGNCRIEYLDKQGIGIAHTAQGKIALPYTIEGEIVSFEKHSYRGQTNSFVSQILEVSPERVLAPCEYFSTCGGCRLQHLSEESYNEFKLANLQNSLSSLGADFTLEELVTIRPKQRRRASFKIVKKQDRLLFGFYRYRSHNIVNIEHCLLLLPELAASIIHLKIIANQLLNIGDEGELDVLMADNGLDISFKVSRALKTLAPELLADSNIIRISVCCNDQTEIIYCHDTPFITIDSHKVEVSSHSFMQPTIISEQVLANIVLGYCDDLIQETLIADLFCGRGTFALPLSRRAKVEAFEIDNAALKALELAGSNNITLFERNLFEAPLTIDELAKYHLIIINPPRTGAILQAKNIARTNVSKVIYISCNPTTFALDANELIKGGYKLTYITPIDQFYWSVHLEIIAVFEKI